MRLSAIGGSRYKYLIDVNFSSTFASYNNQTIYTTRVSAFSFYLKKKTPAKEKQTQGFAPRPRERRAAVHSLYCSVGSSAHSPVNSLRSNSTGSCGLLRKPSPRSSQIACYTAARLSEACSSGVIKSLTLLFCVFSQASQARPRVRLRKSGSGLEAPSAAAGHFLFDVDLVVHQPSCAEEQTD